MSRASNEKAPPIPEDGGELRDGAYPDLSPANYPAENPPVDLDRLARSRNVALLADAGRAVAGRCRCSRHDQKSAGAMATAMNAGFGTPLPEHVTTCTEPDRPNDPDVQRFWREADI